jgi:CRP-like cAMP-binding protein/RsiW-degrading membrane proteinase PrsW (M82 family)
MDRNGGVLLGLLAVLLAAVATAALGVGLQGLVAWPSWVQAEAGASGSGVEVRVQRDPSDPERPRTLPPEAETRLAALPNVIAVVKIRRGGQVELDCGDAPARVTVADLPPLPPPVGRPLLAAGSYPADEHEVLVGHKRAHRCGLAVGTAIELRPVAVDDGPPGSTWAARVVGLVGSEPWDLRVPAASYARFGGDPTERSLLLQVPPDLSRGRLREAVREALPEIPARALVTRDQRQQAEQRAGGWRLRATALVLGGLLAAGVAAAGAYAVAGALGGAALFVAGIAGGLGLVSRLATVPTTFQVPYLAPAEEVCPLAGSALALVLAYGLSVLPRVRRRTRLGALLSWAAGHREAMASATLALLAGAVWLYAYGFVDPELSEREAELRAVAAVAAVVALVAPLCWLATRSGRRVARQAWRMLATAPDGEPRVGRIAARLAALGTILLLLAAIALLGATVAANGGEPEGFVFLAEVAAALALVHGYAAFWLGPGAVGAYRATLGLAFLWLLPGITAPLAVTIAVLLLRPRTRAYYRGTAPAPDGVAASLDEARGGAAAPSAELPDVEKLLRDSAIFVALPELDCRRLASVAATEDYPVGTAVLVEGDRGQDLYYLAAGRLVVEGVGLGGEVLPLAELEPGTWFGEMALLTGAPRSATVRALTAVRVLRLPAGPVRAALATVPALLIALRQRVDYLDRVGFLQRYSPFASLPRPTILAAAERFQRRTYPAGAVLVQPGEPGAAWYLVKRGRARITWPDGQALDLGPGDGFGEEALLRDAPTPYQVVAATDLDVLELARPDFQAAVTAHGTLQRFFTELLRARYAGAPEQALALPDPVATLMPGLSPRSRGRAWRMLAVGLALLAALSVASGVTEQGLVITATIVVGSFLAPVVYLGYLRERDLLRTLAWPRLLVIGAITAMIGIPVAIVAEELLNAGAMDFGPALATALIEETTKLFGVVWLLWRRRYRFELDGIVFGVAAGLWFAGLENVVYAIGALTQADSPEEAVGAMLAVVWLRLVTSFFGHGVWTGLICAAIWRGKGGGGPRWDWEVARAFAVAVLLHTLWDWSPAVFVLPASVIGTLLLRERIQRASEAEQQALAALGLARPAVDGAAEPAHWPCRRCGAVGALGILYCARCGAALAAPAVSRS